MADKYQLHATRTLIHSGFWAEKFIDMHFLDKRGNVSSKKTSKRVYPNSGRPDMYYFDDARLDTYGALHMRGGFIEVKSPASKVGSRFDYNQWRDEQRDWYHREAEPRGWTVWMFLVMGKRVNDKRYPLVAYLFPIHFIIDLEKMDTRKSLSYDRAANKLERYKLEWVGNSTWNIQEYHPFREQF